MRKIPIVLFFCTLLVGCNKDQALLDDIKGTWQLEKATFAKSLIARQDSILISNTTSLKLDVCDNLDSKTRDKPCYAYLVHQGQNYKFEYFVSNGNRLILQLPGDYIKNPSFEVVAPFWVNGYNISERTAKKMVLECTNCNEGPFGTIPFRERSFIFNK